MDTDEYGICADDMFQALKRGFSAGANFWSETGYFSHDTPFSSVLYNLVCLDNPDFPFAAESYFPALCLGCLFTNMPLHTHQRSGDACRKSSRAMPLKQPSLACTRSSSGLTWTWKESWQLSGGCT